MKKFFQKYFPVIPVAAVLLPMLFSHSCANTTQAPTGGVKDTIPPVVLRTIPKQASVNVPVHGVQLVYTFNEYVTVKNGKNIYLSPPQQRPPKYKLKGKSLVVYFEEDLLPNTTYTLSMTDALADNNEGNMFPGFTHVFSTGSQIDSMMITGIVQDCNTLDPIQGATVMLYSDLADSAVVKERPVASIKTDQWGFFCLRNVGNGPFRLYALKDENNNNRYDPDENELIAFADSVVVPSTVVADSIPELQPYDMKDTLACLARKTEYELNLFRAKPSTQYIVNKERPKNRSGYITFMAPKAHIDTMWIKGIPASRLITQFNPDRDSLEFWVNDRRAMPDTFQVFVNYLKTDSTGALKPNLEQFKLIGPDAGKTKAQRNSRKNLKHEDTTCVFKLQAEADRVEQYGFEMEFEYPIINEGFDSVQFWALNPKQQRIDSKFKVEQDSTNLRCYTLRPVEKMLPGYEYFMKVPYRKFRDINGHYNDSVQVKVSLPSDEKLSTFKLACSGVHSRYIVDLLNDTRKTVLRTFIMTKDETLVFPYLKAGKYSLRITEDADGNNLVGTGDLFGHRQPEKVKFYKLNDSMVITIPESMEIEQELDIETLFN